ncbi:hypothetical protein BC962_0521 [Gillisia mitskevichiae]|uniref:PKD domain-containing protein n=1 Tax=Gillisia mitskevichiae TaxID=270921 RepID=A0A495PYG8_9FLAO|nr:hypothetical protein [Gillisia mitskevichiae]RKS55556.1 hypothetical protein BC962_0521 [Gillisia mitskevichiae]
MKIFKFLAMLTISVLLFTGCEKEEITNYAFQEISAPTNVKANFDVAQDDSGKVTITPSGEGAQVFQVYFGDGDDSPLEVAQGETVSYTYGEGEYLVKVIAVGSTGLTSEFNQRLLISFRAPENLDVTITQPASNPAMISVSAAADFAATFDVYFGDIEEEEPTQLMPDGSIDHIYATPGTYTVRVVAKGAGVATTETTVEVVVPEANDPVKLPITYDIPTVNYALGTFEGATFEVVTNPFLSGANTAESRVGKLVNSGSLYEGGAYTLVEPVDFSGANKTISMKFYSDKPISVLVKFEGGTNDDRPNEVAASHGGTGWEVLTFNFATDAVKSYLDGDPENGASFVPTGKYSSMVIFAEIGKTTTGTFYIDDIEQEALNTDPFKLPVDFEGAISYTTGENSVAFEVVTNPKQSGINDTDTKVGAVKNTGVAYEALSFMLDEAIDFSGVNKIITIKVFSETAYPVVLKLETGVNGERANEVEVNHGGTGWEVLSFDFNNARKSYIDGNQGVGEAFVAVGEYDNISLFLDFAGTTAGTFYIDDIELEGMESTSFKLPATFDGPVTYTTGANSVAFEVVTNPKQSGINATDTKVGAVTNTGVAYEALSFMLDEAIDFSGTNKTITMKVFSETAYPVALKLETGINGERANEVEVNHGGTGWEVLSFDFNNARKSYIDGNQGVGEAFVAVGEYDNISLFLDFAGTSAGTFYIDDIEQK